MTKGYFKTVLSMEDTIVESVDSFQLMAHTREISKWIRVSGTEQELESLGYVSEQLKKYGFETKISFYPAFISIPCSASVELVSPEVMAFEAITHCFSTSTPVGGLICEVVNRSFPSVTEKVVLSKGLPSHDEVLSLQEEGAKAVIYIQDNYLHNGPVSPIWGNPVQQTEVLLPQIPVVSIRRKDGEFLEQLINKVRVKVRVEALVNTGWNRIPLLEAEIKAKGSDKFILFGSHIDSWDFGAMDNGSANATALEAARLTALYKDKWQRGLRLVFWSGHSQGKFAGSAWYADNHWEELLDRCDGYIYSDSTGGKDAVIITEAPVMPQTKDLAADVIKKQMGEIFVGKRLGHFADQSFFGVGLTSIFGTFSEQDASKNEDVLSFKTGNPNGRGGGLGWWWHTAFDTLDKVDPNMLVRDTKIYSAVLWRLLTYPVLPYDFRASAAEIENTAILLQRELMGHFELGELLDRIEKLKVSLNGFYQDIEDIQEPGDRADLTNEIIRKLSHYLVRVGFLENSCFGFDLSGPMFPIPSLTKGMILSKVSPNSHAYYVLQTEFRRGLNKVMYYLRKALEVLD